jgi:hypothetical protein
MRVRRRVRRCFGTLLGLWVALLGVGGCGTAQGAAPPHHQRPVAQRKAGRRKTGSGSHASKLAGASLPPLAAPTPAHPLGILVIGDSLGEDLGMGLRDLIGQMPAIRLYSEAVGSTGLVNTSYYDWQLQLENDLRRFHPQLVVALFGGNDALSFDQDGRYVPIGSGLWRVDYGGRVASIMRESRRSGARVIWVGLPIMGPNSVLSNRLMQDLNSVYAAEAKSFRGITYVSTWALFSNSNGSYAADLPDSQGRLEVVRDPDGTHIAPAAGTDLIATAMLTAIDSGEGLRICPASDPLWHTYLPTACPGGTIAAGAH